jgi:hypothetical protein
MAKEDHAEQPSPDTTGRSRSRGFVAACLGLSVLAYTLGVILGLIPEGQRIDVVLLGLLALVALVILLLLWPEAVGRVKIVEVAGFKVEMLELKEKQVEQRLQLEDIKLILPLLLPEPERKHLLNLARNPTTKYKKSHLVQDELRHLRSLGLIKMKANRTIGQLPDEFELADHFETTERGKRWVSRYGELEGV